MLTAYTSEHLLPAAQYPPDAKPTPLTLGGGSAAAFAYGSPDVIPLFAKGLDHVVAETYPSLL